MTKKGQHVVRRADGSWSVRKTGAARATKAFKNRKEAVDYARTLAQKQGGDVYIHAKDGTIRGREVYIQGKGDSSSSSDIVPPRGGN